MAEFWRPFGVTDHRESDIYHLVAPVSVPILVPVSSKPKLERKKSRFENKNPMFAKTGAGAVQQEPIPVSLKSSIGSILNDKMVLEAFKKASTRGAGNELTADGDGDGDKQKVQTELL